MSKQNRLPFRLKQQPFGRPSSRRQVFLSPAAAKCMQGLVDAVLDGRAVTVLLGEAGVGKTILRGLAVEALHKRNIAVMQAAAPLPGPVGLQQMIGDATGIPRSQTTDPDTLCRAIQTSGRTGPIVLVLDDAHTLPQATLHYLWLMVTLLGHGPVKLQVVLVGGLELEVALRDEQLRGLQQASGVPLLVPPLADDDVEAYLDHKLRSAGASLRRVMAGSAIEELLEQSGGIPSELDLFAARAVAGGAPFGRRKLNRRAVAAAVLGPVPAYDGGGGARWAGVVGGLAVAGLVAFLVVTPEEAPLPAAGWPGRVAARAAPGGAVDPGVAVPEADFAPADLAPRVPALASSPRGLPPGAPAQPADAAVQRPDLAMPTVVPAPDHSAAAFRAPDLVGSPSHPGAQMGREPAAGEGLVLLAKTGDSMPSLYSQVYRGLTPPPYAVVVAANPPNLRAGDLLVFPAPPSGWKN